MDGFDVRIVNAIFDRHLNVAFCYPTLPAVLEVVPVGIVKLRNYRELPCRFGLSAIGIVPTHQQPTPLHQRIYASLQTALATFITVGDFCILTSTCLLY